MAHEIFISYSSKDKPIADGICANLEAAGLRCWIAPRDISPGEDFPSAIARAINDSKVFVLVFSQNSNMSDDVSNELYLAFNNKIVILPFKIEDVQPIPGKAYYLGRTHWLDAMTPPTLEQIDHLIRTVRSYLNVNSEAASNQPKASVITYPEVIRENKKPVSSRRKILSAISIFIPLVLGFMIFIYPKLGSSIETNEQKGQETSTASIQPAATKSALNFSTQTISKTPVIKPTEMVNLVDDEHAYDLFWEDFDDPQYEGILPPFIVDFDDRCTGMEIIQKNGVLSFHTPPDYAPWCGVNFLESGVYKLSDIKSIEFTLGMSATTRPPIPSFGPIFGGRGKSGYDNPSGDIMVICSLGLNNCVVTEGQEELYKSKTFTNKPGSSNVVRIEIIDPIKMRFQFFVNDQKIGEYTFPEEKALLYNEVDYNLNMSVVNGDKLRKESELYLDNVRIIPR